MAPLCSTAPAWKSSESSALFSTLSLLADALKIAAALFAIEKVIFNGWAAIEDSVVRDDVSAAMTVLSETLRSVESQPDLPEAAKELLRLVFPSYRGWFGAARRACSLAAADIYKNIMAVSKKLAEQVEANTPRYAHLFQKCISPAAKKVLLKAPGRDALMNQTLSLHGNMATACEWRTRWTISVDEGDEDMKGLRNVFDAAKVACSVTAACAVLWEQSGADQIATRNELLKKKRPEWPNCLLHALEAL